MIKTKLNLATIIAGMVSLTIIGSNISTKAINSQSESQLNFATSDIKTISQRYDRRGRGNDFDGKGRLWSELNLTSQQQEQMQEIRAKYQPQMTTLRQNIDTERDKLQTMMAAEESENMLRNQHQKIVEIDQQIHSLRFESMLEMRSVLTSEQRQQFREIMNERRASRQRRFR